VLLQFTQGLIDPVFDSPRGWWACCLNAAQRLIEVDSSNVSPRMPPKDAANRRQYFTGNQGTESRCRLFGQGSHCHVLTQSDVTASASQAAPVAAMTRTIKKPLGIPPVATTRVKNDDVTESFSQRLLWVQTDQTNPRASRQGASRG